VAFFPELLQNEPAPQMKTSEDRTTGASFFTSHLFPVAKPMVPKYQSDCGLSETAQHRYTIYKLLKENNKLLT